MVALFIAVMRKDSAPGSAPNRPARARFGVLVCLLAWFLATPSLLPAAVAGLGSLDGQHRVSFAEQGGRVAVIFHHASGAMAPAHQHSSFTKVLTALAQSRGAMQDHVLTFGPAEAARARVNATEPTVFAAPVALPSEALVRFPARTFPAVASRAPCAPPVRGFALVCLRSTLLLI